MPVTAGALCLSHGGNRAAPEVQQAAGHVAHLSLSQPFPPFPQECALHPAGEAHGRAEGSGGLHPPLRVCQGCQESQKGEADPLLPSCDCTVPVLSSCILPQGTPVLRFLMASQYESEFWPDVLNDIQLPWKRHVCCLLCCSTRSVYITDLFLISLLGGLFLQISCT